MNISSSTGATRASDSIDRLVLTLKSGTHVEHAVRLALPWNWRARSAISPGPADLDKQGNMNARGLM
eukprot:scaffold180388_cov18-Prasinocladus_malaysianus.AAC.1